ncbi:helix-turn-helix domain-containing protein [Catellatospora coxensis]|uniref:Helix-turn-helix domain-containing protein n=1 Tax=Catellatospora coxensis TaxID=310354 RepID=A0A8J3PCF7_9ACTN|nr:helix-turn-helix domain-containing protein [Catellatospora coxensis]GIG11328.1 hypothetical protein Cco03nite_80280 [Catellatospora coxensis]
MPTRPSATHRPIDATRPDLYRPGEVAKRLRCSEWWIKEQARKRRIPYSWIGGSYRFTEEHVKEIIRLFEVEPIQPSVHRTAQSAAPLVQHPTSVAVVTPLRARVPRRARTVAGLSQLAA